MDYTKDQQKAIDVRGKNILVAAAAGSGKTRVLVERIIKQLMERELSIDELLVVTFTSAAAAEMRERIEGALQKRLLVEENAALTAWLERQTVLLTGADISTFHSFCQQVIRKNIEAVEVDPQFRLAGEQEMVLLKRDVLEDLLEKRYERPERAEDIPAWEAFLSFVDDYGNDRGDDVIYEAVLKLYAFSQSQPYPKVWLRRQQEVYETAESLFTTPWFQRILAATVQAVDACIRQYDKLTLLVGDAAPVELQEEWKPYVEVVQADIDQLEAVRGALRVCEKNPGPGCFDAVIDAAATVSWGRLAKKEFKPLKADYPEVRNKFDEARDKVKKGFGKIKEKYLLEREQELSNSIKRSGKAVKQYVQLVLDFMDELQAAKKERNILDFNDLEHFALEILCGDAERIMQDKPEYVPTEAAISLREQYKAIMVDEYQDTNGVQEAILSLIARENNCFTVGDVKQSIYRFRLADPYLFQAKYDSFPEEAADGGKNQLITMKKNFRSRAEVLSPINFIFEQIMRRDAVEIEYDERSRLHPGADYPQAENTLTGPLELDILLGEKKEQKTKAAEALEGFELEAQHIANRIQQLMEEKPVVLDKETNTYRPLELRDIAVLMRAVQGKADVLLETLRKNGISAYADVGGGYFEASEVRIVLALLSVLDNARQDIPLASVLASPIGGFSMKELVEIRLAAEDGDLYDGLLASFSPDTKLSPKLAERTAAFQQELAAWRNYAISHSVPELIWMLYRETGYYDYVGSLKGGLLRQANLRMLADRAADYERTNYRGLFRFLRFIDDLKKRETDLSVARTLGASENVVRIMTIHKSKGLEFPVVILANAAKEFNLRDAQGIFLMHQQLGIGVKMAERSQTGRQIYNTMPWQAIADKIVDETKAEEMRVLYVALTRAREKLIITGMLSPAQVESKAKSWGQFLNSQNRQLPVSYICQAKTYLDWIAPAIARHKDGEALREFMQDAFSEYVVLEAEEEARFAVRMIPAHEVTPEMAAETDHDRLLEAAAALKPMPPTEAQGKVEACLSWQYDMGGLDEVPAKLTVTEIKHRFAEYESLEEESLGQSVLTPISSIEEKIDFDWPRPRFMQDAKKGLSAAERGSIMHMAMQHLDLHGDRSFAGIRKQLENMERCGILQPGQKEAVYIKGIQGFAQSEIGERLRRAVRVWRELPFSRMLPAKRFYPEVKSEEERVFTQGVIDLLFEEEDGSLVLVDYKTDRSPDPEKALRRYRIQVDLYSEAVQAILNHPVRERYLYLLQSGQLVKVPVPTGE